MNVDVIPLRDSDAVVPPRKKRKPEGTGSRMQGEVRLARYQNEKRPKLKWEIRWFEDGKRRQKRFETKTKAEEFQEETQERITEFGSLPDLTHDERATVLHFRGELAKRGITLRDALTEVIDRRKREEKSATVSTLFSGLLSALESAGRSERYLSDLRSRLGRFEKDFGDRSVATISPHDLADWIRGLKQSPTSQNNSDGSRSRRGNQGPDAPQRLRDLAKI